MPEWKRGKVHFAGYDPDQLYDMYLEARGGGVTLPDSAVAQRMRRLFPMSLNDGVVERPEGARPITAPILRYILEGEPNGKGGHAYRRKKVPQEWMAHPERY